MNRLKLNWNLVTSDERSQFINEYLPTLSFQLNEDELECAANYIFFGKDADGKNVAQRGEIELETKNKTWQKKDAESLDALMESPTFNEAVLKRPTEARPRIKREVFSRSEALSRCPESMQQTFIDLFAQIDELDLCINYYEILHEKRKNPPRAELAKKYTEEQHQRFQERVTHWNQSQYLKRRHLLVELRREQFTLRDSFIQTISPDRQAEPTEPEVSPDFEAEIPVFPLGVINGQKLSSLIFKPKSELNPKTYTEDDLKKISDWLWHKNTEGRTQRFFDFTELEHVYQLFQQLFELEEGNEENQNTTALITTLKYYLEFAELSEAQTRILDLKIKKVRNQDIANLVNDEFGKSYTANYISTIFRQKIIPKINEAAAFHKRIVSNLFFEEEFKKCTACGIWMLRDPDVFVRKTRAKDGLANRCKKCDKLDRQNKKEVLK